MKVACIVPISALDLVSTHTYHLALAHVAMGSRIYKEFYRKMGERGEGERKGTVIFDNSSHELGRAVLLEDLRRLVKEIEPSISVVPDSLWDAEENLLLAKRFEKEARKLNEENPEVEFMAVPHGKSREEVIENLKELLKLEYVNYIGLSKTSARLSLRKELAEESSKEGRKVHFLGVWSNPLVEVLEGKELERGGTKVVGLDTKYPAKLGVVGRSLLEYFPAPPGLNFLIEENQYSKEWLKRQIEAFVWLAESDCGSEWELRQEFENGRF